MTTNDKFEELWLVMKEQHATIAYIKGVKQLCRECYELGLARDDLASGPQIVEQDFEYWWDMYDKKRGRDRCLTKWKRMTPQERRDCIRATPQYVASTPDKQYRKDPLSYLNQKAWTDEIINRNNGTDYKEQQLQQRLRDSADLFAKYTGTDK